MFNKFFCSVVPNIQSKIDKFFNHFLKNPCNQSIFIKPCTNKEIIDKISDLSSNKAAGPNSIPIKTIRLARDCITNNLPVLFNLSFSSGVFSDKLKIAKVLPAFKKGSKLECSNYRPISLLSNLDKVNEKLMHKRLMEFLNEQKILYCKQYGFRKGFPTAHAIINLIDNIESDIDNKQFVCGFFIDLQKVFDTVDQDILLEKIQHYGIRGIAHQWFKSYLENRKQFVSINSVKSELDSVNYGVPQGSALGPLLFLIYINDLHYAIKASCSLHFADDTFLLSMQSSIKQVKRTLNKDLKQLALWLNTNKISLSVAKTKVILFKPKKTIGH